MSELPEPLDPEVAAIVSAVTNADEQETESVSTDAIMSEPLGEGIPGDTLQEWQDVNQAVISELENEPPNSPK